MARHSSSPDPASSVPDAPDPTQCVSYRLRRAARLAARAFDAALKPTGLRNTQFTALSALAIEGEQSIGSLSKILATDATTLNRNLELLIRRGFVDNVADDDGRVRNVRISTQGRKKYEEALPLWQEVQTHITAHIHQDKWTHMITELEHIEDACKTP